MKLAVRPPVFAVLVLFLALLAIGTIPAVAQSPEPATAPAFTCDDVTEISHTECQALAELSNSQLLQIFEHTVLLQGSPDVVAHWEGFNNWNLVVGYSTLQ